MLKSKLESSPSSEMKRDRVVLGVTGSIAAFKAAHLCSKLTQAGVWVDVVLTESAKKFIGAATFEGITGRPPLTSLWQEGQAMEHLNLSKRSDLVVIYPATANFINKTYLGLGEDLLSALMLGFDWQKLKQHPKLLLAPAMNTRMWEHPATIQSVNALKERGVVFLEPEQGKLACGDEGVGRLLEPEKALERILHFLNLKDDKFTKNVSAVKKRILITAGGTEEAIDPVRVISNVGTGRTGLALARDLVAQGHHVSLLIAQKSAYLVDEFMRASLAADPAQNTIEIDYFVSSKDLEELCRDKLKMYAYDTVIHSAAVSDFKVSRSPHKISSKKSVSLELIPQPKILDQMKSWSKNKKIRILAFKLTTEESSARSLALVEHYPADGVFLNSLDKVSRTDGQHEGYFFKLNPKAKFAWQVSSKKDLVKKLGAEAIQ